MHIFLIKNKKGLAIAKQVIRSGTSIGANINEANYGQSPADFISKMHIALKETAETEYWIKLRNMSEYIDDKMKQIEEDRIASAKEVLMYLTKGMRQELEEEVVVTVNTGDYTSEPQIIKKKISIKDANKCAELLGKRYSLFTEKVDLNGDVGITIIDDIGSLEDE